MDKEYIPIPTGIEEDEIDLSDQDLEFFEEFGGSVKFLTSLDEKGIARCVSGVSIAIPECH